MFTDRVGLEAPASGALWVVQILGAIACFILGLAKLSGDQQMVRNFDALGLSQWSRYASRVHRVHVGDSAFSPSSLWHRCSSSHFDNERGHSGALFFSAEARSWRLQF